MSIEIMVQCWKTPCKTHTQKLVLIALADNANDQGICWPSLNYIGTKCDLSRQAVASQVDSLVEMGLLKVRKNDGRCSVYEVLVPRDLLTPLTGRPVGPVNAVNTHLLTPLTGPVNAVNTNRKEPPLNPNNSVGLAKKPKEPKLQASEVPIPKGLDTPEFRFTWDEWLKDRKRRRKEVTEFGARRQLAQLSEWGPVVAVRSINQSITNGWQGLFEPRQDRNGNGKAVSDEEDHWITKESEASIRWWKRQEDLERRGLPNAL